MKPEVEKILSISSVTKTYGGNKVLDNANFDLYAGEIHCLVGENGAGKSTLIKIITGAVKPDSGNVTILGKSVEGHSPHDTLALKVSAIYQDAELVEYLSVADNIFLGQEIKGFLGRIKKKEQNKRTEELLNRLNVQMDPDALISDLSPSQRQQLQIVKALHNDSKILIMDEPTASLGEEETVNFMNLVRVLKNEGIGIIYISHFLEEIFELGDRITVLKDGIIVASHDVANCDLDGIIKEMIGRDGQSFYNREHFEIGETLLEVNDLSSNVVKGVSFKVRKGEIFGIGGLVGSGRTELINLLFGIDKKLNGEIKFKGDVISPNSPEEAIKNRIGLIVEDRKAAGLFAVRSVSENMSIIANKNNFFISQAKEKRAVKKYGEDLSIRTDGYDISVDSLSGGNQQKVLLARTLMTDTDLLIFDEPTKGVDIGAKEDIYSLMVDFAKKDGKAVIMISSSMPELMAMSDKVGVMREGRMTRILDREEISEETLIKEYFGL